MSATTPTTTHSPAAGTGRAPWPALLRVGAALQFLGLVFQAVTAGLLFTSEAGELAHAVGARVAYGAVMLYALAAVLAWRPGGGPARPVGYAAGFLALVSAQVLSGIAHAAWLHLPLGVTTFALTLLALLDTRSRTRGRAREDAHAR
ncbi:hypothetical protein ACN20G_08625 [Streptomyces sp. BI20]|uniref:hypothetical protein n=1 Tax=Streptomyces sp. BI20 TaxID=3403460 RepID=UPI003C746B6F